MKTPDVIWAVMLPVWLASGASSRAQAREGAPPAAPAVTPAAGEASAAERAADLVHEGNAARERGQIPAALAAYRRARDLAPGRYEIRILLADTLRRAYHAEEAAAEYHAAAALDASRPEAYAGQALLLRAAYDYDAAVALLEGALGKVGAPARPDLLLTLAETRRRQGRPEIAEGLFGEVLAARPGDAPALAGRARVAEDRGDLAGAIAFWDRYLAIKPDEEAGALRRQELRELKAAIAALRETAARAPGAAIFSELGRLLAVAGDAPAAAGACRRALKIDPESREARRLLALVLRDAGDRRGAAAQFRRSLERDPADGTARYNLVALAREAGDPRAEESAWTTLLAARPDDVFAARAYLEFLERTGGGALERALQAPGPPGLGGLRLKALLLSAANRGAEAAATLLAALRPDPTDPWTLEIANDILSRHRGLLAEMGRQAKNDAQDASSLVLMGRLMWLSNRGSEALILCRRAVAADPRSAVARSALAELLQQVARDPQRALEELRQAVALDPSRLAAHVDLALTLLRGGRAKQAEEAARAGLAKAPVAAPLLSVLGAALAGEGDLEGAAAAYAQALVADPVDNFGLARSQYPLVLAGLGLHAEARHALRGDVPPIPEALYREAWAFTRDSYRDRTFHGQDWEGLRDRPHGTLRTPQDAYRAIAALLASLGDPYTRLRDADETAALYLARRGDRATVDALGRVRSTSKTVVTEDLPGGLGYIRLTNLTDPRVVEEVRQALQRMRLKEGIVLDLRGNGGGLARSADAIGDLLIGPGKETGTDVGTAGQDPQTSGGDGAITDSPLTVLVDGQTASAAERLARALEASGRAALRGERTYGKGLGQATRVLPGGMTVLVSIAEMLGPDGRPLQGKGLAPRAEPQPDTSPAPDPESPQP